MAAFKVTNIMIDCKYDIPISNLQQEIETLKRENNELKRKNCITNGEYK